jgi:catechol 2,3-dioxygenase-like lactoylglutathione lyase family enzyme
MLRKATPIVRVTSSSAAEAFYCGKLGFTKKFEYRPEPSSADPCFMGVCRDGAHLHLSSFSGDGPVGVNVQIVVDDVDGLLREYREADLPSLNGPMDQTWGTREIVVRDADGNKIIFAQEAG